MHQAISCLKTFLSVALLSMIAAPALAVIFNFSAIINPGTCTFSLDKSTLSLGTIPLVALKPATLVAEQPFTLIVQNCTLGDASLIPVINVSGDGGVDVGGKWLFRSSDSTALNVGVMLVKTNVPPSYNDTEVKNGDDIPLAGVGQTPPDQNITFYAAATCGAGGGCTNVAGGSLSARILFNLAYR
jgi:type 1 fimbria pilin